MCKLTYLVSAILLSLAVSAHGADRLVPSIYPTIQAAIDAAVNGDTVTIADGTYTGVGNRDIDFGGKAITVRSQNGPGLCTINGQNYNNSFGFRFDSGEPNNSVLDGITITNCYNGIIISNSNPTIRNCNISTFYYTGIGCTNGSVQISNCKIKYGQSYNQQGGVYLSSSSATISSSDITDNYSRGITAQDSRLEMDNCLIARNSVYGDYRGGGGICFESWNENPDNGLFLHNCIISNNTARGSDSQETMMEFPPGCRMGCPPEDPGCIPCQWSDIVCVSEAQNGRGGGIYFNSYNSGELLMSNCLVTQNIAQSGCRMGIECYGEAQAYGGGIYIDNYYPSATPAAMINCTIANNQAYKECGGTKMCDGGGVYVSGGDVPCQILNSILWGNTVSREPPEPICNLYCNQVVGNVTIDYTVVQYGSWSANPLLAQGPLGNYYLSNTTAGQSYSSPCINAGDNSSESYGLDSLTTSTDNYPDLYQVDLGYHYQMSEQPSLSVTSPNGGEIFISGRQYPITWQSTGSVRDVRIEYSTNAGLSWTQVSPPNAGNSGSYLWTVPALDSNQCLVKITETSLPDINDGGDAAFTIFICHLTADLTSDCKIDLDDFAVLASQWLQSGNPFESGQ